MENYTDEQIRRLIYENRRAAKRQQARRRRTIVMGVTLLIALLNGLLLGEIIGSSLAKGPKVKPVAEDVPIVNTAMKEIGNEGGDKFWSWYGFDSHQEWCACFVSWCEDQQGYLDEGLAPRFALVSEGGDWFENQGQWLDGDETPQAGDVIFFDWEGDGARDHVGLVASVTGKYVFTVEGNSSDRCRVKRYELGSPVIYGYGHIDTSA